VWSAPVKDQLEDRLRRMVCRGDVALGTAQRDISTDWIAAYRKYFHADQPVSTDSPSASALPHSSVPLENKVFTKYRHSSDKDFREVRQFLE
jgi:hypothetical protein